MNDAPRTFEEAFDAIASEVLRLANDCLNMAIGHALPIDMHEYLADVAEIMAWLRERLWPGRSPLSWARARYWERRPETDSMWTQLAAHALLGLSIADGQEPDVCLRSLRELMVAKQRDYSPSNILDFGQVGCLVRANDKVRRLENLLRNRQSPRNESIRDSWADLTNYAIIARMVRQGWFTLPLAGANDAAQSGREAGSHDVQPAHSTNASWPLAPGTLVYVSGPYSADTPNGVLENIWRAREVAVDLWRRGCIVLTPHLNTFLMDGVLPGHDGWIRADLVLMRPAQAVVLVPGWRRSKGSRAEVADALSRGVPVYEWVGPGELRRLGDEAHARAA